jgi:hypothetical protein
MRMRSITGNPARRPDDWLIPTITVGFLLLATAFGAVIAAGNLVTIALVVGGMLGLLLLGLPGVALGVVLLGTLVLSGPLVFFVPALDKLPWLFSILGFLLVGCGAIHAALVRRPHDGPLPIFVVVAIAYFAYTALSAVWYDGPTGDAVSGIKRYLQFWGVLFVLSMVPFSEQAIRRLVVALLVLSVLQTPLAIYQRLFVVPNLPILTMDAVAGFFEVGQAGMGAVGVLAYFLIAAIGAWIAVFRERAIQFPGLLVALAVVAVPLLIGEINVMFVWIPLVLLAVYADQVRSRPLAFVTGGVLLLGALVAFGSLYLVLQQLGPVGVSPTERLQAIIDYNFGTVGYSSATDLNRSTVYAYWARHHGLSSPLETMFGHGVGASYGAEGVTTPLNLLHAGRSLGLVSASSVLWDLGVVGLVLFVSIYVLAAIRCYRLTRIADPGFDRGLARALFGAVLLLGSTLVYNNAMVLFASQEVLGCVVLGLIAWLDRRYTGRERAAAMQVGGRAVPPAASQRTGRGAGRPVPQPAGGVRDEGRGVPGSAA